uniref:CCHC-type domain-containing protein n=1 Tax=Ananas comosus var. bracteatus TaxID=296719 RepID=A0A6V7PSY3_ANACO|nr:unnamed protein product [Ananas comosus var. bracteatus]
MPATAGRVRMPANNRVHSSAALQTHGIWQSAIGYDPYAPTNKDKPDPSKPSSAPRGGGGGGGGGGGDGDENAYASFQGLLALARITGSSADEARGACKKCGRVGHLPFQCRNFLSVKDQQDERDEGAAIHAFDRIKKASGLKEAGRATSRRRRKRARARIRMWIRRLRRSSLLATVRRARGAPLRRRGGERRGPMMRRREPQEEGPIEA